MHFCAINNAKSAISFAHCNWKIIFNFLALQSGAPWTWPTLLLRHRLSVRRISEAGYRGRDAALISSSVERHKSPTLQLHRTDTDQTGRLESCGGKGEAQGTLEPLGNGFNMPRRSLKNNAATANARGAMAGRIGARVDTLFGTTRCLYFARENFRKTIV